MGVVISQDAQSVGARPSHGSARHGDDSEHGTAQETGIRMVEPAVPPWGFQIFPANYASRLESWLRHISQGSDYARVSEAAGHSPLRSVTISNVVKHLALSKACIKKKQMRVPGGLINKGSEP